MKCSNKNFRDFENLRNESLYERIRLNNKYLGELQSNEHLNYRLTIETACGPVVKLKNKNTGRLVSCINLSSNDYLGFTQHEDLKQAAVNAIFKYGTGAGASPLIGGFFDFHEELENSISCFFKRPKGSSIIYTSGYTTNSASLLCLLKKEDIAILDIAVHASIYEGIMGTNSKRFLHNDVENLERILINVKDKYRTKMVIIDGVYSQDGDLADFRLILEVAKHYGALIMVDDAHGVGVIGNSGRGVIEINELYHDIDFIMGTFSKALGSLGGFIISNPEIIKYLQFQSRQYTFSTYLPPNIASVTKALELIDTKPEIRASLWNNIAHYKSGLKSMGLEIGNTNSAIIPVKIGASKDACEVGKQLLKRGIFANSIMYPAVSLNDARIRMCITAMHTTEHIDQALNAFNDLIKRKIIKIYG